MYDYINNNNMFVVYGIYKNNRQDFAFALENNVWVFNTFFHLL